MTDHETTPASTSAGGDNNAHIAQALHQRFSDHLLRAEVDAVGTLQVAVDAGVLVEVCRFLSEEAQPPYPYLSDAFGADYEDHLQVLYHLFRAETGEGALVRTDLPREDAVLPTLTGLYNTAKWAEREIAEMFGVTFEGHPDPRKLLLPDDWAGYPLRKDYQRPDHPYLRPEPLHENPPAFLAGQAEPEVTEE